MRYKNMKKHRNKIISLSFLFLFALPVFAYEVANPIESDSLSSLIGTVFRYIQIVAFATAPIIFMYAGFMYYVAQGDPKEAKKATQIIKYTIIGIVVILLASSVTAIIKSIMGI
jgi:hypothetical protein